MTRRAFICGIRRNRLISALMSDHPSSMNRGEDFKLRSGREFESRASVIFNGLEHTNEEKSSPPGNADDSSGSEGENEADLFARPIARAPRKRPCSQKSFPDFTGNAKKWKKYTLSDVPDHSDKDNVAAATQFLSSLKRKVDGCGFKGASDGKIVFSKPDGREEAAAAAVPSQKKSVFSRNGAFVMPECVVGRKASPTKKVSTVRNEKKREIHLSHLDENELEET